MKYSLSKLLIKLRAEEPLRKAAARIGISHTYLNMLEKGIDPRSGNAVKPTAGTLQKLSGAYNYPYVKLMEAAGYLDSGSSGANAKTPPVELEKIIRESNVMLDGMLLDDGDKEDILQFVKIAMRAIKKEKG
ncbi:hypothetical protein DCCM_0539 [Desulfocucumis palustris]|uniref:HTH cro/C1-type domain-containing protein n=1 Tax=Desulfocucumis palustris TaxID=1898651 RepID=A0A2L2X853_9FIRM|nr:helix-turn-helix transcriptional regulator [Desulfocucumis palustris]GBF32345.1 hypothetical protein DCCM_0539 [Desulfocucumis palustris]